MITFTSAQLAAWIAAFIYPVARVLAFVAYAPVFNNQAIPRRVRLTIGLTVGVTLAPLAAPIPAVDLNSGVGLLILAREVLIGFSMAMVMRIYFAALNMAGEQIGAQMGLGFATFYDPQSVAQAAVIGQFIVLIATLVFLSINGHLMMIATLAESFKALPIATPALSPDSALDIALMARVIFASGLLLALPITVTLIITNLALGVLNRAAPQLNLFAIGFPITIVGGFVLLLVSLNYLATPVTHLFEQALAMMLSVGG